MANSAAHKPEDLEAQFQGEARQADGYDYWATSEEDENSVDFGDMAAKAELAPTTKVKKERVPGRATEILKKIFYGLLLVLFVAILYFLVTLVQVFFAEDDVDTIQADAIIVMGAAQVNGTPSPVFQERLDHAYNLWNSGRSSVIFTTGATYEGEAQSEGKVGADYLRGRGVDDEAIVQIVDGENTYQQLTAAALQLDDRSLETVLLVSDGYHNYRLLDIADEVGIDAFVSPSAVEASIGNYFREASAVSIGRVTGYRRLSSVTE